MNFVLSSTSTAILALCFFCSCQRGKGGETSVIESADSVPGFVDKVVASIATDNPEDFARLVSYPLARPYPLRDIKDEEEMKKYYRTMVDDSLREAIAGEKRKKWQEMGWRGWTLDEGQYVWVDSLIYDVPYISRNESMELERLSRSEMESLAPQLRHGWLPLMCLKSVDSDDIFRIDRKKDTAPGADSKKDPRPRVRLAFYRNGTDLKGRPTDILEGTMTAEGTMQTRVFTFHSPRGTQVTLTCDPPDGSDEVLVIIYPESREPKNVTVIPVYWLDLK